MSLQGCYINHLAIVFRMLLLHFAFALKNSRRHYLEYYRFLARRVISSPLCAVCYDNGRFTQKEGDVGRWIKETVQQIHSG